MIVDLIDTQIKAAVQHDGGNITFVRFDEEQGTVYVGHPHHTHASARTHTPTSRLRQLDIMRLLQVRLEGACSTCESSKQTLEQGVSNVLKFYVPDVQHVVDVGAGGAGEAP